ncbi:MAG TPA: ABC transporter permease [bacterium]|nr:ABC transporter permease [bacterium]HEX67889.1 ABC transporter permease [bacterium]
MKKEEFLTIIRPPRGISLNLKELWEYRELLYFLIWRDIKVRYKQTLLGAGWAILQPFLSMVVFSIFFGKLAKIPTEGIPYPIFAYTALVPWNYFAHALNHGSLSLVEYQRIITKVYFPRILVPLASVLSGLLDFFIAFLVLIGMMFYYHTPPTLATLTFPFFLGIAIITAFGISLWLSALNVEYRDVRYALPFFTQFMLFLSPVVYSSTLVPEKFQSLYGLNPMSGVIEGFRWALLGKAFPSPYLMVSSIGISLFLLFTGLLYFQRMERTIADIV